ncbi:MAG: glycosyltransferase family 4 protein [Candidatus Levybacteria bacterium]|nr:glycosyltransferase family 4 protein [Candidatus Levybacteria bacterium]
MKIGIFDPYLDSLSGGEKYMLTIAKELSSRHKVFIFWNLSEEKEIRKKSLEKLGIDLSSVFFSKNIFSKDTTFLERLNSSREYDLIICLSDGSIPFVLSKLYLHFQFPVEWVNGNSLLTKIKLLRVNKIICNSFFTKQYIDKKFNVESNVLYPPIFIKDKKTVKENIILHVGRFGVDKEGSNFKKQDFMIEMFKKLINQGLRAWEFRLIIGVGRKDEGKLNLLKQKAKGYPIFIIDNPPNSVLWKNYAKAKIYWHATGFGENLEKYPERAEHFGISTVEAMGAGVVPVVINAGGQKEIVENGKNGFLWDTSEELITKTELLSKDLKLWETMSKASVEKASKFSGNRFKEELEMIVNK